MKVLDQLLEDCLNAKNAKIPVVYIRTYETELINELVRTEKLVRRRYKGEDGGYELYKEGMKGKVPWNYAEGLEKRQCADGGIYSPRETNPLEYDKWEMEQITVARGEELGDLQSKYNVKTCGRLADYIKAYVKAGENSFIRRSIILLYSEENYVPEYLRQYVEYIDVKYPEQNEIEEILTDAAEETGEPGLLRIRDKLCSCFSGMNKTEIRRMIQRILYLPEEEIENEDIVRKQILKEKEQIVKRNQILELLNPDEEDFKGQEEGEGTGIGGLERLKEYVQEVKLGIDNEVERRKKYGAKIPKGILVCGIPGCGKSLAARYTARTLGLPLLKLDVGLLMGSFVGESEHNMQAALQMAEAMAPCVLFIDELDKAFSASKNKSDSGDGGTFKRMFSRLLGWMQDRTAPCFIFATANDVTGLPSEFFRSGRFDRLYAMYLPMEQECMEILKARLNTTDRKGILKKGWQDVYLQEMIKLLAQDKEPRIVTGADIEKLVNESLNLIANTGKKSTVTFNQVKDAMNEVLKRTNVYGDGIENRIQIAKTYLQLLSLGFVPTSEERLYGLVKNGEKYELKEMDVKGSYNKGLQRVLTPILHKMQPRWEEEMWNYYMTR